jgi:FkbM family methyltransferase
VSIQAFLYRRLSRWATCELQLPSGRKLPLRTKYDVASASDVFCHPFYWQIMSLLDRAPALVVDCGANCGHFCILCDACVEARFGESSAAFTLIEPNPLILPILNRNLSVAGLQGRCHVSQGLLGQGEAKEAALWVSPNNYLSASLKKTQGGRCFQVPCMQFGDIVSSQIIDVLKVDIEGGEYELVKSEPEVFTRARVLMMEVHDGGRGFDDQLLSRLRSLGLTLIWSPLKHGSHTLIAMKNAKLC